MGTDKAGEQCGWKLVKARHWTSSWTLVFSCLWIWTWTGIYTINSTGSQVFQLRLELPLLALLGPQVGSYSSRDFLSLHNHIASEQNWKPLLKNSFFKMVDWKDVCSSSPGRTPKLQLAAEQPSTGDTQTLKGRSGSVPVGPLGPGVHKVLFEPSEHLWWLWGLILNMILPLLPSCWFSSFAVGHGVSFLVRSNILLSMVIQQQAAILEFLQEKMSAHPPTPSSNHL